MRTCTTAFGFWTLLNVLAIEKPVDVPRLFALISMLQTRM
jgi:hypothetical protein